MILYQKQTVFFVFRKIPSKNIINLEKTQGFLCGMRKVLFDAARLGDAAVLREVTVRRDPGFQVGGGSRFSGVQKGRDGKGRWL